MKICTFQGTFNPLHNGHVEMARFVLENFNYEKIILSMDKSINNDYNGKKKTHRGN